MENSSPALVEAPMPAPVLPSPSSPYTVDEAAVILRVSVKTVRRLIVRGCLRRCDKVGRVLIPRKDVDTFIERNSSYAFAA